MGIVKPILLPGTQLAASSQSGTGDELCFIQEKYKMYLTLKQDTPTIAVNLSAGQQIHTPEGQFAYGGTLDIDVNYYSKWSGLFDETLDAIYADIAADLERMKSNIQENDATEYGGTNHTIGLAKVTLSSYDGQLDDALPGLSLIKRVMTLSYNIMPY
jgi:hypothetical protein